jgi:hypothetical protein
MVVVVVGSPGGRGDTGWVGTITNSGRFSGTKVTLTTTNTHLVACLPLPYAHTALQAVYDLPWGAALGVTRFATGKQ